MNFILLLEHFFELMDKCPVNRAYNMLSVLPTEEYSSRTKKSGEGTLGMVVRLQSWRFGGVLFHCHYS